MIDVTPQVRDRREGQFKMPFFSNSEIEPAVRAVIQTTTAGWVLDHQPVHWRSEQWRLQWARAPQLPHGELLDLLEAEVKKHGYIRRRFVLGLASQNTPLLIAAMAWGYGPGNIGPSRTRAALVRGEDPEVVVAEARIAMFSASGGVLEAYRKMFSGQKGRIYNCRTAFATKVLHFLGYQSELRPRPLIYDRNVASALARLPDAPPVPHPDELTAPQYLQYCQWAEGTGHEPIVVEYALFKVGSVL